jgi:hypothetical protein
MKTLPARPLTDFSPVWFFNPSTLLSYVTVEQYNKRMEEKGDGWELTKWVKEQNLPFKLKMLGRMYFLNLMEYREAWDELEKSNHQSRDLAHQVHQIGRLLDMLKADFNKELSSHTLTLVALYRSECPDSTISEYIQNSTILLR